MQAIAIIRYNYKMLAGHIFKNLKHVMGIDGTGLLASDEIQFLPCLLFSQQTWLQSKANESKEDSKPIAALSRDEDDSDDADGYPKSQGTARPGNFIALRCFTNQ
eukprot:scaffold339620_cov25-Prasinocladus_malaysianus.AAC.1